MPVKKTPTDDCVATLRGSNCTVYYEKGVTKNMGDYNSAKVTVGVTLPIDPTTEEVAKVQKTIEVADKIVTQEMEIQLDELLGDDFRLDKVKGKAK